MNQATEKLEKLLLPYEDPPAKFVVWYHSVDHLKAAIRSAFLSSPPSSNLAALVEWARDQLRDDALSPESRTELETILAAEPIPKPAPTRFLTHTAEEWHAAFIEATERAFKAEVALDLLASPSPPPQPAQAREAALLVCPRCGAAFSPARALWSFHEGLPGGDREYHRACPACAAPLPDPPAATPAALLAEQRASRANARGSQ